RNLSHGTDGQTLSFENSRNRLWDDHRFLRAGANDRSGGRAGLRTAPLAAARGKIPARGVLLLDSRYDRSSARRADPPARLHQRIARDASARHARFSLAGAGAETPL